MLVTILCCLVDVLRIYLLCVAFHLEVELLALACSVSYNKPWGVPNGQSSVYSSHSSTAIKILNTNIMLHKLLTSFIPVPLYVHCTAFMYHEHPLVGCRVARVDMMPCQ